VLLIKKFIKKPSVTIAIVVLLLIILCHMYAYTSLFSKVQRIKLDGKMD
jgi:flagellar basal body-associated protein FliL